MRQMKNRAARCLAQREACSATRPGAGRGDRTLLAERIIVFWRCGLLKGSRITLIGFVGQEFVLDGCTNQKKSLVIQ